MKFNTRIQKKWWLIAFFSIVIMLLAFFPLPYVLEMPGSAESVATFIHVEEDIPEKQGSFFVTTVHSYQATPLLALQAMLPHVDLISKKEAYGPQTVEDYYKLQAYHMEQARNAAILVAYREAGRPVSQKFDGMYVMHVVPESNFVDTLQVGDLITKMNQQVFESETAFLESIRALKIDDLIEIEYVRDQEVCHTQGKLVANPDTGLPMLGIQLVARSVIESTPTISFDAHGVSGPSAGLMFALEIYNQLEEGNLKRDRIIAGTGTIDDTGKIGRIGGIDKKVVAAARANAAIFLAPDDEITEDMKSRNPKLLSNYEEAVQVSKMLNTSMKIYPVKTFKDALAALEK